MPRQMMVVHGAGGVGVPLGGPAGAPLGEAPLGGAPVNGGPPVDGGVAQPAVLVQGQVPD